MGYTVYRQAAQINDFCPSSVFNSFLMFLISPAFVCFSARMWRYRHLAKNTAQTGARGRLELEVGCERLLPVEGLDVTLR